MRFMTNAEDFGQFGAHTAKELTGGNADMKKFYNNPEMNVSVFAAENVVTDDRYNKLLTVTKTAEFTRSSAFFICGIVFCQNLC